MFKVVRKVQTEGMVSSFTMANGGHSTYIINDGKQAIFKAIIFRTFLKAVTIILCETSYLQSVENFLQCKIIPPCGDVALWLIAIEKW